MRLARFASVALLALAAGTASADDTVDNPEFPSWAKVKKGTSVTLKTTATDSGVTSDILVTSTLIEAGDNKLVVETTTLSTFNGMEFKTPPTKRDVTKALPLPKGTKKEDLTAKKVAGVVADGTETIKIAGTDIKTKWVKTKIEKDGTTTETKMWTSEDVPGLMVKMELTMTGKLNRIVKTELVEFKKP